MRNNRPRALGQEPGTTRFTLLELLVVIAVIMALAALLLPALSVARERGRQALCHGNLKNHGLALWMYADDCSYFPQLGYDRTDTAKTDGRGLPWDYVLLPYLGGPSVNGGPDLTAKIRSFNCPDDATPRATGPNRPQSYIYNANRKHDDTYRSGIELKAANSIYAPEKVVAIVCGNKAWGKYPGTSDVRWRPCVALSKQDAIGYTTTHLNPWIGNSYASFSFDHAPQSSLYLIVDGHSELLSNDSMLGYWNKFYGYGRGNLSQYRWVNVIGVYKKLQSWE